MESRQPRELPWPTEPIDRMKDVFGSPADVRRWHARQYVKPLGDVVNAAGDLVERIPEEQRNITSELLRRPYWAASQRRAYGGALPGVHSLAAASYRAGGGMKPYYQTGTGDEGMAGVTVRAAKALQTRKHPTPLAALSRHMYWRGCAEDVKRRLERQRRSLVMKGWQAE